MKCLIKEFKIAGYKRIQELTRPLTLDDTLTVLYGPNSSGKTSILQGIQLLLYQVYGINVRDIEIAKLHRYLNFDSDEIMLASKLNFFGEYIDVEFRVKLFREGIREHAMTRIHNLIYYFDYENYEGKLKIEDFEIKSTLIAPTLGGTHHLLDNEVIEDGGVLSRDLLDEASRRNISVKKLRIIRDKIISYVNLVRKFEEEGLEQLADLVNKKFKENLVRFITPQNSWEELNKRIEFLVSNYGKKFTDKFIADINYITEFEFADIVFRNGKVMFVMKDKLVSVDHLSTGLLNMINMLTQIYETYLWHKEVSRFLRDLPKSLVILDIPEFNIHVDWLLRLLEVVTSFDNIQVIIETHSGLILSYAMSNNFACYYLKPINGKIDLVELTRENIHERFPEIFRREVETYQQVLT